MRLDFANRLKVIHQERTMNMNAKGAIVVMFALEKLMLLRCGVVDVEGI